MGNWTLQKINVGGLTSGPAASIPVVAVFNSQLHFVYGNGGAIWDSFYDLPSNLWNLQRVNLGGQTSGPAYGGSDPFSVSVFSGQLHFTYRQDQQEYITDAWYDPPSGSWSTQTVNFQPTGNGPDGVSGPSVAAFGSQLHFCYLSGGTPIGLIADLWFDRSSGSWSKQWINNAGFQAVGGQTNGPSAAAVPAVTAYTADQLHFVYLSGDGAIWDAWYDFSSNNWGLQKINLGGVTAGPVCTRRPLVAIFGSQLHVAYTSSAGELWDAWWDGFAWNLQKINLGGQTNGPGVFFNFSLSVFLNRQLHFAYVDNIEAIWDVFYDAVDSSWSVQKINMGGRTSGPAANGGVTVNAFDEVRQLHFAFPDATGTLWDAYYTGD